LIRPYPKHLQGILMEKLKKEAKSGSESDDEDTMREKRPFWCAFKIQVIKLWQFIVDFSRLSLRKLGRKSWRINVWKKKSWRRKRSSFLHLAKSSIIRAVSPTLFLFCRSFFPSRIVKYVFLAIWFLKWIYSDHESQQFDCCVLQVQVPSTTYFQMLVTVYRSHPIIKLSIPYN
jgi:hypothetical protein